MSYYNKCILVGNLVRANEISYNQNKTAIINNCLAINERRSVNGKQSVETTFIDFTAFNNVAELLNKYTIQGSSIMIEGRLKIEQWEKDGVKHSKPRIIADKIILLGGKQPQQQQQSQQSQQPSIYNDYSSVNYDNGFIF